MCIFMGQPRYYNNYKAYKSYRNDRFMSLAGGRLVLHHTTYPRLAAVLYYGILHKTWLAAVLHYGILHKPQLAAVLY